MRTEAACDCCCGIHGVEGGPFLTLVRGRRRGWDRTARMRIRSEQGFEGVDVERWILSSRSSSPCCYDFSVVRSAYPLAKMSSSELACTYACLILHDNGIAITVRCYTFYLTSLPVFLVPCFRIPRLSRGLSVVFVVGTGITLSLQASVVFLGNVHNSWHQWNIWSGVPWYFESHRNRKRLALAS